MDIRFDSYAAERLIREIYRYCSDIKKETQSIIRLTRNTERWNDNQKLAFEKNAMEIAKDLDLAVATEVEYMRIFSERVQELRG